MKSKAKVLAQNLTYSVSVNLISMLMASLNLLILPKAFSPDIYGYYQLYAFYLGYSAVLLFGYADGLYLKLGGQDFNSVDKASWGTQFWMLTTAQGLIFTVIGVSAFLLTVDENKKILLVIVCISSFLINIRYFFVYLLQATNKIKEYSILSILEKVVFVIGILIIAFLKGKSWKYILIADVLVKLFSTFLGGFYCRKIILIKLNSLKAVWPNMRDTVNAGYKLALANLCCMLIIGVIRFGIERNWDLETFGKISFTITLSNLLVQFISAVSIVLFPVLRTVSEESLKEIYGVLRNLIMLLVFGAMIFYYPISQLLENWLPEYLDSIRYAAILFPICAFECKMSLLVNTYYKTLRMEKPLMIYNLIMVVLSVICTFISTQLLNSQIAAVLSILFVLGVRSIVCEIPLARRLGIRVMKENITEVLLVFIFVIINWYFALGGMFLYTVLYVVYLTSKKNDIKNMIYFGIRRLKG